MGPRAFLAGMGGHRFVLCPPGNGVDTHRFWETLVTGGIPVAMRSPAMEPFFHLPAVWVDDFRCVTRSLLEAEWERLAPGWRVPEEVYEQFWKSRIDEARRSLQRRRRVSWDEYLKESLAYAAGMIRRRMGQATFL